MDLELIKKIMKREIDNITLDDFVQVSNIFENNGDDFVKIITIHIEKGGNKNEIC